MRVVKGVIALTVLWMVGCVSEPVDERAATQPTLLQDVRKRDDGTVWMVSTYYLDKRGNHVKHGTSIEYSRDGKKHLEIEYKNGMKDGELTEWRADGGKVGHGFWERGKETGLWQAWQPTGEKMWEATYRDGRIVGTRTWWAFGKVERLETYDDAGNMVKLELWYPYIFGASNPKQDSKQCEGYFLKGRQHGTWTYWNMNGSVMVAGEWKAGKPWNGVCATKALGDAGSLCGIMNFNEYKNGKRIGPAALQPEPRLKLPAQW